ncbi:hypothetical protein PPYR_04747 [Photinus pyralis]|uniref:Uncharacterized protein n=1 Tax=Photinus pyralis TaxID=7054 RepID=A0A5N4AYY2_PHOPY|nr:hypothetical protein PPYR_04747 [Photinus pyralis]
MVDFERAAINPVRGQFPEATLCGLQRRYNNDPDFALQLRQLAALAFVPEDHGIASYEELIDSEFYTDNENLITGNELFREYLDRSSKQETTKTTALSHKFVECLFKAGRKQTMPPKDGTIVLPLHLTPFIDQATYSHKGRSAQRIKNIVADYENRSIMEYLRRVAHNFQYQV